VDHCGQQTSGFKRLRRRLVVTVVGVGFFDFLHGQTGVADNGIEFSLDGLISVGSLS
jgi:hypothetical protein